MPEKSGYTFKKEERLSSKKEIESLFIEGDSCLVYPLKVVYRDIHLTGHYSAKVAFAVSKRLFKKAVARNLIKRRMRESYRLNKHTPDSGDNNAPKAIIFIYIGKELLPFKTIEKAMVKALGLLWTKSLPNP